MAMAYQGELAALATACCWTVTALAFQSAGRRIGSLAVNLIRLVLALGLLVLHGLLIRGRALPLDAGAHAWLWLALSGLVGFTLGDLCLFRAFVLIGARLSLLLMSLVPPMTVLLGFLVLRERPTLLELSGMALTVAGVAWVVLERPANGAPAALPLAGILLGLAAALGQAGGLILSKYGMGAYDPFGATQIRVLSGIAGFAVLFSLVGTWPRVRAGLTDRAAMQRVALGAFFGPFLGVSLSLMAVQHTLAGVASTLMAVTPILIIPPSIILFGERVSPRAAAGAVLAVAGVGLLFW